MGNNEKAINLAVKFLKINDVEAEEYCYYLEDIDAYYFSVPVKGGDSIIIGKNGEVLYANSSVNFDAHKKAFVDGLRTPIDAFGE